MPRRKTAHADSAPRSQRRRGPAPFGRKRGLPGHKGSDRRVIRANRSAAAPRGVVFMTNITPHCSTPNRSGHVRADLRYQSADVPNNAAAMPGAIDAEERGGRRLLSGNECGLLSARRILSCSAGRTLPRWPLRGIRAPARGLWSGQDGIFTGRPGRTARRMKPPRCRRANGPLKAGLVDHFGEEKPLLRPVMAGGPNSPPRPVAKGQSRNYGPDLAPT